MQKKSIKLWIWLLASPFIALIAIAVLQFIVKVLLGSTSDPSGFALAINIFTTLLGILAVLLIFFGTPIWIIMIVVTSSNNNKVAAPTVPSQPAQPQDPTTPAAPPTPPTHQ